MASSSLRRGKAGGKDQGPSPEQMKNVPAGIDASTFFSPLIPSEVRACVPILHDLTTGTASTPSSPSPSSVLPPLLDAVVRVAIEGQVSAESMKSLQERLGMETESFGLVFTGLHTIITHVVRNRIKSSVVAKDLTDAMNVPPAAVCMIIDCIKTNRARMEEQAAVLAGEVGGGGGGKGPRVAFPTVEKLKWRVDVTISSSSLSRVLKPTIIMQMLLSDGSIRTMEVPIAQFHQLRYKVAKVLHSMQELERHPIMRLVRTLDAERKPDL